MFVKVPKILQNFFPKIVWRHKTHEKKLWLTFDDGPDEKTTNLILEILKKLNIKATFFLIGQEIKKFPDLTKKIIDDGHTLGNHSFSHTDGFRTKKEKYVYDVELNQKLINEKLIESGISKKQKLFRPPYGRILPNQFNELSKKYKIIMWDVFSWDFKENLSKKRLQKNVLNNVKPGSIIVFHNNKKSYNNLFCCLEKILISLKKMDYSFSTTW